MLISATNNDPAVSAARLRDRSLLIVGRLFGSRIEHHYAVIALLHNITHKS